MAKILLISYDNDSHIPFFPQNIAYLGEALIKAGHQAGVWLQDIHHGKEEALTEILDKVPFDVVGLGFVAGYYQYRKARLISKAVGKSKRRKEFIYVLGGHGPAGAPTYFKERFGGDAVVIGDGEKAITKIAETKEKGIIYGEPSQIDEAPIHAYEQLFPLDIYKRIRWPTSTRTDFCFPILSSRGCKWHCSFCYRMREGFHERSVEAIMDEIRWLHNNAGINHFQFSDELLMSSKKRTEEICQSILNLNYKVKWDCNGRLNYAHPEILSLMKKSGCEYINYGIESLDQSLLDQMRKGLTVDQIHKGVEATLHSGLSPGLNLLWGFPGDTVKNLKDEVDFLKKYDLCHELRTIRPVTPYPGCSLYRKAIDMGLLKDADDFYENKHKNSDLFTVNFMDIPIKMAYQALYLANKTLYSNFVMKRIEKTFSQMDGLYFRGDTSFRGFRDV